jgi:hypothetical protein
MCCVCWHIPTSENYPQIWKIDGGIIRMYPSYTSIYQHIPAYDIIWRDMSGYQGVRIPAWDVYCKIWGFAAWVHLYTHLESWPHGQESANLYIKLSTWYRHVCTCLQNYVQVSTCMCMLCTCTFIYIHVYTCTWIWPNVCTWYIHVHRCWFMYGYCTDMSVHVHNYTSFPIIPG